MSTEVRAFERPSELIGSYRIDGRIASGGMGVGYRAAHTILPRRAAIKVLHAGMANTHSAGERLLQEARILDAGFAGQPSILGKAVC
jgi:serine/threonine protein kinase